MTETILFDSRLCTGCRACELACGFRFTRQMDPSWSAIRVRRDDRTGRIDAEFSERCDVCQTKQTPMCIQVCSPRALTLGRTRAATLEQVHG